jgi:hypothetical protein
VLILVFRKRKIVRRIESSDSEAQEEETESNERVENIPHKGHNSTFKVSKCNIEIEAEDTNFRSSKLGLNNHQSSKKTSPKASKYRSLQKEYVPLKIFLGFGIDLFHYILV